MSRRAAEIRRRRRGARGFSLLEVMIALGILAVSLMVLLTAQGTSMGYSGQARDLTVATLLARSKMIDIEQKLFDEGFSEGNQTEEGDFGDEGRADIRWETTISEIELDLGRLDGLLGGLGGDEDAGDGAGGMGEMLGALGAPLEGVLTEISNSVRVVELNVTWPTGGKFEETLTVRALVSREDYNLEQLDADRAIQDAASMGVLPGGATNPNPNPASGPRDRTRGDGPAPRPAFYPPHLPWPPGGK